MKPFGFLPAMLLLVAGGTAAGEIHKCSDATGKVSYTDRPCAPGAQTQETRAVKDTGASVAGISALCAEKGPGWKSAGEIDEAFFETLLPKQRAAMQSIALGLAYGGSGDSATRWRRSRQGNLHFCTTLPDAQVHESVAGVNGEIVSFRAGQPNFVNDPDTPSAALERCSNAVTTCYSPPGTGLATCVDQVPTCSAAKHSLGGPECCPQECKQAFRTRLATGEDPMSALQSALFGDDSCVPGMNAALGR